jgi:Ribbon-helix-helix protein, copG family
MSVARRYKTLGFSVPPMIVTRIEEVVKERQLTRSEFFREMFRAWERLDKQARKDVDSDEQILKLFAEVKEEEGRNPTPKEKLLQDFQEMSELLQKRAKERGLVITEDGEILENQAV